MFYRSVSWISLAVDYARVLRGPMTPQTPGQARIERRIMVDLNFIAEAKGLCSGQEMRERADRGGETGEWPATNPEGIAKF